MVAHSHEQIEPKRSPSGVAAERRAGCTHLDLHGTAALEGAAASNDQSEVVGPKVSVAFRSERIGIFGTSKNRGHRNPGLQALLAKGNTLELT